MLLSDLLETEVRDEAGGLLGRVHDVRVERLLRRTPDGHRPEGSRDRDRRPGIRERLGLDTGRTEEAIVDRELIDRERVREIDLEQSVIVVADEAG
jgi:hypothetical protein